MTSPHMDSLQHQNPVAYSVDSLTFPSFPPPNVPVFSGITLPELGGAAALGTDRKLQAASSRDRRRLFWARWRVAAALLPDERIKDCRQYASYARLAQGRAPSIVKGDSGYRFAGICRCKSIWGCPLCSASQTELRRKALESSVDYWRGQGKGFLMVTYTIAHTRHDDLGDLLARLGAAQVRMCEQRAYKQLQHRYGILHHVRSMEVTVGKRTGWHPHRHDLAFCAVPLSESEAEDLAAGLRLLWVDACKHCGLVLTAQQERDMLLISVDVRVGYQDVEQYIEKHGDQPRWSLAAEVTKAASKASLRRTGKRFTPFQLLDAISDPDAGVDPSRLSAWFQEYYAAFKGRHQLAWSRGAQAALQYVEPEPDSEDAAPELVEFTWPEWLAVRRSSAQCEVLEACDRHGYAGFLVCVNALVEQQLTAGGFDRPLVLAIDGRYRFEDPFAERQAAAVPDWVRAEAELVDPDPDLSIMFDDLPDWVF